MSTRKPAAPAFVAPPQDGPLPPWLQQQMLDLLQQRGHAWLLQGPSGLGQYAIALGLVRSWLCEQPQADGSACGHCESCHGVEVRTHPDLFVLMPETQLHELDWPLGEKAQKELDDKKRKPSKEIRIESMRDAVEFSQRTSSRNRGKAVLIYPAERMNHVTANALLKTLEEPPGDVRFVLATEAAHQLLPTIRSRCMTHTMAWPQQEQAAVWLEQQGLPAHDAAALLQAAGGRPHDALALASQGVMAASWRQLPQAAWSGQVAAFAGFTPLQAIDALQKICHDAFLVRSGSVPRFFATEDFPTADRLAGWNLLTRWSRQLARDRRSAEHPYNPGLFLEDLLSQARLALQPRRQPAGRAAGPAARPVANYR